MVADESGDEGRRPILGAQEMGVGLDGAVLCGAPPRRDTRVEVI